MRTENFVFVDDDSLKKYDENAWEKGLKDDDIFQTKKGFAIANWLYMELSNKAIGNNQKDPYGIQNVNFTLITPDDDRWELYRKQRLERGFDNTELWSLDHTIIKFCYPRMKAFREIIEDGAGYPAYYEDKGKERGWLADIDKVIKAMYVYLNEFNCGIDDVHERNRVIDEGFKIWMDNFGAFWY